MRISTGRLRGGRTLLMSTVAGVGLLTLAAAGAHAQDANTQAANTQAGASANASDTGTTVVVTGIRRSLQDALTVKRRSNSIVEAVSAEDIGKLPDESIADSLTRLPGLAGQIVKGRYQDVSIRGLSPDFTATLLNDYQQASTGDNRAAEYDQYPSELINGATVYKTPDATLVGQGLAGTVDLHTVNPLDFSHRVIAVDARGTFNNEGKLNPGSKTTGNRLSAAYIDRFMGGRLGISLGYAHEDSPDQEKHYHAWWWDKQATYQTSDGVTHSLLPAADANAVALQGAELYDYSRTLTRDSVMGTIAFRPTDNFTSINDFFVSKMDQAETMHGVEWYQSAYADNPSDPNAPQRTIANPTFETVGGQLINTGGTINYITPIIISNYNTRKENLHSLISRNRLNEGDWTFQGDLSYSYAERKETNMEQYAGYGSARTFDTITYSNIAGGSFPTLTPGLSYANASTVELGDPAPWGGWGHDGTIHDPHEKDTFTEGKLAGTYTFHGDWNKVFSSFNLGVDYSDRVKHKTEDDRNLFLVGSQAGGGYSSSFRAPIPTDARMSQTVDLSWGGFGRLVDYDPVKALSAYVTSPINDPNMYDKEWQVTEKLATYYAQLNIESQLFGFATHGNIGAQYVAADQQSRGFITQGQNPDGTAKFSPYAKSIKYGDFLPNFNLTVDLPWDQEVRLGLAREMSRPRLDDLRANASAGVSQPGQGSPYGTWSGSGGNPNLRPWLGDAIDLTYTKYVSKSSYLSLAWFHKHLLSYIYSQTNMNFDFTGYPNLSGYPVSPVNGNIGQYTQPENGHGGNVEGLELSGTLDGKLVHPLLDGFGVTGSYSRSWTDIMSQGPSNSGTPLPGFSGTVYSWTAFYEKYGFSARISERYRAAYRGEVAALFATLTYTEVEPQKSYDAQISYDIKSGPLAGTTLLLQGYNLTNEPYKEYLSTTPNSSPTQMNKIETYGRVIMAGFNYKFQ
jgi:iron complex outermembrane receptor protein